MSMTTGVVRFGRGNDVVYVDPETGRWCRVRLTGRKGAGGVVGVVVGRGTLRDCRRGELWVLPESWLTLLVESGAPVAAITFLGSVMSWVLGVAMVTDGGLVPGVVAVGIAAVFTAAFVTKAVRMVAAVRLVRPWLRDADVADMRREWVTGGRTDEAAVSVSGSEGGAR